jgi:glycosyltransferase involved in cell wall biosynthesis
MVSRLAFYPIHWAAARELAQIFPIHLTVVADAPPPLPAVHRSLGWVDRSEIGQSSTVDIIELPEAPFLSRVLWLRRLFGRLLPRAVWIQEEPTSEVTLAVLAALQFAPPRVGVALCENIFAYASGRSGFLQRLLWRRIDVLLATATASLEGIRAAGMAKKTRGVPLIAGAIRPPHRIEPLELPIAAKEGNFIVGFAGRICSEKGWPVLLDALAKLPPTVKCAFAGDGPDGGELRRALAEQPFAGRTVYLGLLPKEELWRFYAAVHCLAVPSLTLPHWKEQFGGVLADGMAMGLPLIGSDSGAIPEVIGRAGLVIPEGDSAALAAAISRLAHNPELCQQFAEAGRHRFAAEFDIPAYARKIGEALGLTARPD